MEASIITVGDELLIGQVVDTNSAWISAMCQKQGIRIRYHLSISDDETEIGECLQAQLKKCDLLIFTGGLGPTLDDKTLSAIAKSLGTELMFHEESWWDIQRYYSNSNRIAGEIQKKQCMIPIGSIALHNELGTAPGVFIELKGKYIVCFPGVPHEMKYLFENQFIPLILPHLENDNLLHLTIKTAGIGESDIAEKISGIEAALPESISLAYLPAMGEVRLRLSGKDADKSRLAAQLEAIAVQIENILGSKVYGRNEDTLVSVIGDMLQKKKWTLSLAESCTGGNIAATIVRQPGVSDFFMGSVVSYSYEAKQDILGVDMAIIESKGAVSEEVVRQMVQGAIRQFHSDCAAAISGIAGPDGGTADKPVGTFCIALGSKAGEIRTFTFRYNRSRSVNIEFVTTRVLNELRLFIAEQ